MARGGDHQVAEGSDCWTWDSGIGVASGDATLHCCLIAGRAVRTRQTRMTGRASQQIYQWRSMAASCSQELQPLRRQKWGMFLVIRMGRFQISKQATFADSADRLTATGFGINAGGSHPEDPSREVPPCPRLLPGVAGAGEALPYAGSSKASECRSHSFTSDGARESCTAQHLAARCGYLLSHFSLRPLGPDFSTFVVLEDGERGGANSTMRLLRRPLPCEEARIRSSTPSVEGRGSSSSLGSSPTAKKVSPTPVHLSAA